MINREWHLLSRPVGWPEPKDFALVETEVPAPGEGQVLVRNRYLSVDPYDFSVDPPRTKGIEGVPHGDLDRYIFPIDHPAWDELDRCVDTRQRRLALSCYAWPGIDPLDCMRVYGRQVESVLSVVLRRPTEKLDVESDDVIERAVARAEIGRWLS